MPARTLRRLAAQPSASATAAREEQSSFAASRPLAWVELGLP